MIEIKRRRAEDADTAAQSLLQAVDAQDMGETAGDTGDASERENKPFMGMGAARDLRAMYRAAYEYHNRHRPARIDGEYWRTHAPGADEAPQIDLDYWRQAAEDIGETGKRFNNDEFMLDLLSAIYSELKREYEAAQKAAQRHA